eukprot:618974-Heterocapsa_arctica.AAC.1
MSVGPLGSSGSKPLALVPALISRGPRPLYLMLLEMLPDWVYIGGDRLIVNATTEGRATSLAEHLRAALVYMCMNNKPLRHLRGQQLFEWMLSNSGRERAMHDYLCR